MLLRRWRQRRRISQLDLALTARVSALAHHLDVPLRERNPLLLAAGYAPVYRSRGLDHREMAPAAVQPDGMGLVA